jgi:hypothetical protein
MFSDSIILYGIGKLILKIKNDYKKSNLCSVADNFIDRFMNLLNKSLIIQFLTSQIRPEDSAINSGLLTGLQGLKVIYRFLKKIAGFIINKSFGFDANALTISNFLCSPYDRFLACSNALSFNPIVSSRSKASS